MREDVIQSITEAEAQATAIRQDATEKASQIIAEAEDKATRAVQSSAEVCRAYSETQIKNAHAEAECRYKETLDAESKKAREYCAEILKNANDIVNEIVGRIVRGDC